jgi:hypothetical protein
MYKVTQILLWKDNHVLLFLILPEPILRDADTYSNYNECCCFLQCKTDQLSASAEKVSHVFFKAFNVGFIELEYLTTW